MSESFSVLSSADWPLIQRPERFSSVLEIPLGWSEDRKYLLCGKDGDSYLLRLSPIREKEEKRKEFNLLCLLRAEDIPQVPEPFEFSDTSDGQYCYMILSFACGECAEDCLKAYPPSGQYRFGLSAGRILRKIHGIPAPKGLPSWPEYFQEKIDRKLYTGKTCPVQYDHSERLFSFIEENRGLIPDVPRVTQHGDYHVGNMIIGQDTLSVIDFNRYSFGDPWEEFNRLPFSLRVSPAFASGQIDGYFEKDGIPDSFFPVVKLYLAVNLAGSLAWALNYGEKEIEVQKELYRSFLSQWRSENPEWHRVY
ncbi:MAG: phosphotransferase [Clostridia bacterium]|nr:phosphotransferase [Clostridia bacterium]